MKFEVTRYHNITHRNTLECDIIDRREMSLQEVLELLFKSVYDTSAYVHKLVLIDDKAED